MAHQPSGFLIHFVFMLPGSPDRPARPQNSGAGRGTQLGGSLTGLPDASSSELTAREVARQRWANFYPPSTPAAACNSLGDRGSVTKVAEVEPGPDQAACPVCGVMMSMAAINGHLDTCLEEESERNGSTDGGGNCGEGNTVVVVSDDDDEPLAKRRGVDDSTEQVLIITLLSEYIRIQERKEELNFKVQFFQFSKKYIFLANNMAYFM